MFKMAPLPQRTYEEINKNRRSLIELGYQYFPESVYPDNNPDFPVKFDWEDPDGRAAVFDIFYLANAGYVAIQERKVIQLPRNLVSFVLTSAGIDLVEIPGKIDQEFPLVTIVDSTIVIGDSNTVSVSNEIKSLERLRDIIKSVQGKETEKKELLGYINMALSHPLLQTLINLGTRTFGV